MPLEHLRYTANGRELKILDTLGKDTGRRVYKSASNQVNIFDGSQYHPYSWDAQLRICRFNKYEIRLTATGVEIWEGTDKLIGFGAHPEIERPSSPGRFKRKIPTVSGIRTRRISNADSADRLEISYDIETDDFKTNITFEVGAGGTVVFGSTLNAKKLLGTKQRLTLEFDQGAALTEEGLSLGGVQNKTYLFDDRKSKWMWLAGEDAEHRVEIGNKSTKVHLNEKVYTTLDTEIIHPDVWGPTTTSDDCVEYGDPTPNTYVDDDGSGELVCGWHPSYGRLDVAFKFANVTVPAGATCIDGCRIECNGTGSDNLVGTGMDGVLEIEDSRTPADYDSTHRPSQRTYHSTTIAWDAADSDGTFNSPEAKTVFQDRIDDDHVSGDNWAFRWRSNQTSGTNLQYTNADAAQLRVEYTPASTTKTVADTGAGADAISQILNTLMLADTGGGADALAGLASLAVVDTASGVDDDPNVSAVLTLSDVGGGADIVSILQSIFKTVADTAGGVDAVGDLTVTVTVPDTGAGEDQAPIGVSLTVTDAGSGADAVILLQELFKSVTDVGVGSDVIGSITVDVPVIDSGQGVDLVASIGALLTVADTGVGVDVINVITETLKTVMDSAGGADAISGLAVILALADLGAGSDQPVVSVEMTVSDAGTGVDAISIVAQALKTIMDAGTGLDAVGSISVDVLVADSAQGSDVIGAILAAVAVADLGSGVDVVIRYETTSRIVTMTMTLKRRPVDFSLKKRGMDFSLKKRGMDFTLE